MWWDCLLQHVQCHSLPVGDRKRWDETDFHNMSNVTHILLDIGNSFDNLKVNQHDMLLTSYVHRKRCDLTAFHTSCNITHNLCNKIKCPVAEQPSSLTSFWNWVSVLRSWETRKQCHWLSFAMVFYKINSHATLKGPHTSCLFCNSLWRDFEKETYVFTVCCFGTWTNFISRQKGEVTYFLLFVQWNLLRLSFR